MTRDMKWILASLTVIWSLIASYEIGLNKNVNRCKPSADGQAYIRGAVVMFPCGTINGIVQNITVEGDQYFPQPAFVSEECVPGMDLDVRDWNPERILPRPISAIRRFMARSAAHTRRKSLPPIPKG